MHWLPIPFIFSLHHRTNKQTQLNLIADGSGYYLYLESTNYANGARADLISPLLEPGIGYCLEFAVNMFGMDMGYVDVRIKVSVHCQYVYKSIQIHCTIPVNAGLTTVNIP